MRLGSFAGLNVKMLGPGEPHAAPLDHFTLVGEVQLWKGDFFSRDVLPDVELGPVRKREDPKVFARVSAPVIEVPQLRALILRVPLAERVAMRKDALLGPGFLLVAPRPTERHVNAKFPDGVEKRDGLQRVPAGGRARFLLNPPLIDGVLDPSH